MNISVSTGAFYKYNYKEILDIIAQTTCDNIELCLNNAIVDVPLGEIIKEIEKRNLNVCSIHTPFEFLWKPGEDERLWINKSIDLARELDAKIITTHITFKDTENLEEQHKKNLIEFSNHDIMICTENMPAVMADSATMNSFLCHSSQLLEFLNEFNIPLTFDTTHWASYNKPVTDGYNLFKDYIRNIHLSDYLNGVEHKILGTGSLPVKEFIQVLQEDNYKYLLTIELDLEDKTRNPVENKTQAIDAINDSLQIIVQEVQKNL